MMALFTSFFAGIVATLSPCVLPVLPLMAGSSLQKNKASALVLAAGLIFSFTLIGLIFSSTVSFMGLTEGQVRIVSASMLILFGIILLSSRLKSKLGSYSTPFANVAHSISQKLENKGLLGQFGIGTLLGAAWGPCVGPTLGLTLGLASNQETQFQAALLMAVFGVGMSLPFLGVAYGFRSILLRNKSKLAGLNAYAVPALGLILAFTGTMMITGIDKQIEASLVEMLPTVFFEIVNSI